ncbi:MAG: poly-gamma-glutamate system protein [Candidatus Aminicenantes bacterium]|nr:MAG: poly-gamma-glutamate system protein [Candidatus Aminicenantes bacterium]
MPNKIFRDQKNLLLYGLFALSLVFFLLARIIPSREAKVLREEMIDASHIMSEAMKVLRECREARGLAIDPVADINLTGIIGVKSSPITTTLGNLAAKRTSANPNLAGLVVFLLRKAGVDSGDPIAVGASGSFPGLYLAVLSAAKVMELEPLILASLGASQWGANCPDSHLLHMQMCLQQNGIFSFQPIAFSIGGDQDIGRDMPEEGRTLLIKDIQESGFPILSEGDLKTNVKSRMRMYFQKASGDQIKAFVNIGGSWSNMGIDSAILRLKPGLGKIAQLSPEERRGVIHAMAALDIPVIHLLFVHGLVQKYGIAWDPVPLPQPGEGDLYLKIEEKQKSFLCISVIYLVLFGILLGFGKKSLSENANV